MIEVYPQLFVGDKLECKVGQLKKMKVLHAAKTCHQAFLDYSGKLDVHHVNYLVANRGDDYLLNLVDAPFEPSEALVESAIGWLSINHWAKGEATLIHCDHGESRAPALALLYLWQRGLWKKYETFQLKYPKFEPRAGMIAMLRRYGIDVPQEVELGG